jgi:hypothetical protein
VEKNVRKVASTSQRDFNDTLYIDHRPTTPGSRIFCEMYLWVSQDEERPTTGCATDLVGRVYDTHHYTRQYLDVTSNRMTALSFEILRRLVW